MSLRASRVFRLSPASGIRRVLALLLTFASGLAQAIECAPGQIEGAYRTTTTNMGDAQACADALPNNVSTAVPLAQYSSAVNACFSIKASATTYFGPVTVSASGLNFYSQRYRDADDTPLAVLSSINGTAICIDSPPPPSCDSDSGVSFQAVFPNDEYPPTLCNAPCSMDMEQRLSGFGTSVGGGGTGFSIYQYRNNGAPCADEPLTSDIDSSDINLPNAGDHSVITVPPGSGEAGDSQQCGLVNGERTCFRRNEPSDNQCVTTTSGAVVCTATSTVKPRDAQGNDLPPDVEIEHELPDGTTEIQHYYTSTTISDNTAAGGTGPNGDGGGSSGGGGDGGDCDPEIEECGSGGSGTGSASSSCANEPDCSDTTSIQCSILRQVWQSNCDAYAFENGTGPAAADELLGQVDLSGGEPTLTAAEESAVESISDEVDVSSWISEFLPQTADAACPQPLSFTAFGETIPVDFQYICDFLRLMSVFLVITSTIGAFRIAFAS